MELRSRVMTALRWAAGARVLAQLFTWVITIFVIRLLSPGDYGLMAMAMAVITLLNLLNEMGMGAAVIQKRDLPDATLRQVFGLILLANLALYVLLFLSAEWLADFFREERLALVVQVLGAQFIFMGLSVIPQSLLEKELDFKRRSILEIFCTIGGGLVTLLLAYDGFGVWALVYGNIFRVASRSIGLNVLRPYLKAPSFSFVGLRNVASFGGWVTLERVLWYVYTEADIFIIGRLLGHELLGIYAVARHLASLPAQKLNAAMTQVSLPAFASIQEDRARVAAYFLKATRLLSVVAIPVFFGMSAVAPEFVAVVLGAKWESAVIPIQIMAIVMPLRLIGANLPTAVKAVGYPRVTVTNLMIACAIVPAGFLIGSQWGLLGVSMAWAVAYPVAFFISVARAGKVIGITATGFIGAMGRPLTISALMYGGVAATRELLPQDTPLPAMLGILIASGVVLYAALSATLNRKESLEAIATVRGR